MAHLQLRHLDLDDDLLFGRNGVIDLFLLTPQHEGQQPLLQPRHLAGK